MAALALCLSLLPGCATTEEARAANDPLEPMNRKFHAFNDTLDRRILEPVADAYVKVTPEKVRTSIGNFFINLGYPLVALNNVLQGKADEGIRDVLRIVFNTTLGIGGLFDVASGLDLPRHEEDFGQTLAVWGVGEGIYLELPFFGPASLRTLPDVAAGVAPGPLFVLGPVVTVPLSAVEVVDDRGRLDTAIEVRRQVALDPYVFTREAYRQRRTFLIYDGDPPLETFEIARDFAREEGSSAGATR